MPFCMYDFVIYNIHIDLLNSLHTKRFNHHAKTIAAPKLIAATETPTTAPNPSHALDPTAIRPAALDVVAAVVAPVAVAVAVAVAVISDCWCTSVIIGKTDIPTSEDVSDASNVNDFVSVAGNVPVTSCTA